MCGNPGFADQVMVFYFPEHVGHPLLVHSLACFPQNGMYFPLGKKSCLHALQLATVQMAFCSRFLDSNPIFGL